VPDRWPTRCISATRRSTPTGSRRRKRPAARKRRCWWPRARSAHPHRRGGAGFRLHGRVDGHVCRQCDHRRGRTRGETEAPAGAFSAAGGARMQEGISVLMQMPRTTVAVQMLKEAGLPYIVVLTHPTTGGVTASYAMLGDVQIAEPECADRLCRTARHRTDHPRKAARRLPARRISAGPRDAGPGVHRKAMRTNW
jgi:hypothetical protein